MSTNDITDSIAFFAWVWVYRFKTFFTYRGQVAIWFTYSSLTSFYSLITMSIIYSVSSGVPGWSYFQILVLSYMVTVAMNILYFTIDPWDLVREMRFGGLDMQLVRPYGVVTLLLSMPDVWPIAIGGIVSGVAILIFALLHVSFSIMSLLGFVFMFSLGSISFVLFTLLFTILSYHLFKSAGFIGRITNVLSTAGNYPLSIYGAVITLLFTVVLPIGIASYYPAEALFGELSALSYTAVIAIEIVVAAISYKGIYALMKRYTSGGG
jgi:ABC-2 type transport system permease protein